MKSRPKTSFTIRLAEAELGSFHVLDEAKAKRLGARTMYVPSVEDVFLAIKDIPLGTTRTSRAICMAIAQGAGADITCPARFKSYWNWLAFAAETEGGRPLPWWRVTRNGQLSNQLPGGPSEHLKRISLESDSFQLSESRNKS